MNDTGNVTAGQHKLKSISTNFPKMAISWHKKGPDATLATWTIFGHNLVICYPILTFFFFKMLGDNN